MALDGVVAILCRASDLLAIAAVLHRFKAAPPWVLRGG